MLSIVILIITCTVNLLLGLLVLLRNPKAITSRSFFLVSVFISAWAVSNYLTGLESVDLFVNQTANRLAFFFAFLAMAFGLRFTVNFLGATYLGFGKLVDIALTILGVSVSLLSLTHLVAGVVTRDSNGVLHFSIGPLLPLYIASIALFLALVLRTLLKIMSKSHGRERQQALFILAGFTVTPILALITNAIIPSITQSWHTAAIGPLFTILLVGSISYAIIRHQLFDIRLAVARSLGYALSVGTVVLAYSVLAFGMARLVFDLQIGFREQVTLAFFSAITAFFFQPIKVYFNKISNKFFYQDAYDPQNVLDKISTLLVRSVDIDVIKKESRIILESTLHTSSFDLLLSFNASGEERALLDQLLKSNLAVDSVDDLRLHHKELYTALRKRGVAVVARLRTAHEDIGFLLLGDRKSGAIYTSGDQRFISLLADELAVGMQNALRFKQIEKFNATLQDKVDEATKKLRHTNERLRVLDQTKDDFISMASHQLRTPLTSVKGYVSMVLDGDAGKISTLQRKLLTQSFISSQRMVYLISDLLNVSRLKTGKFVIENVPTNLAKVIQEEVEQLEETVKGRNLHLSYHKPEHFPTLMLDETKIRQVMMNFIDNAVYYTPSGGHIDVFLADKPQSIEFTVVDDGIGVPKAEQHRLFSKFYRAPNAKRARPDGTGLGIFMAKKVIIAQGGAIIFKSQEGKGSTFGFALSKGKLQPAPETEKKPE